MLQRYTALKRIGFYWLLFMAYYPVLAQNNVGIGTTQPNPNAVLQLVAPNGNQGFLVPGLTASQRQAATFVSKLGAKDNGLIVFDLDDKVFYYWSDSTWMPMLANTAAGGDLTGTYPAPAIREGVVGTEKLADNAVTADKIANGTIQEDDFFSPGGGKVLTTTGSGQVFWDNQSIFGLSFLEQGRVYVGNSGNKPEAVDLRGIGNILVGNGTTAAVVAVNGDLTLNSSGNAQIVAGAVGANEVQDNSLTNLDINENAAIVGTKIIPVFGAQNISTTGNLTAQDLNVTGKATSVATTDTDNATTLTTKGYLEAKIDAASLNLEDGNGIADFVYNGKGNATVAVNNGAGLDFAANGALQIADDGVTAAKLNPDVAGQGITQNTTSGAMELNINGIGEVTTGEDDQYVAIYDISDGKMAKITRGNWLNGLNADNIIQGTLNEQRLPDPGPVAQTYGNGGGDFVESIDVDSKGRIVNVVTGVPASDIRLKKEIRPLEDALSHVLQLQGYHYYWKDQQKDSTLQLGLIAQELEKVYPELVKVRSDHYKGVNYLGLIPVLVEAIKEQQKTIQSLQDQLKKTRENQQLESLRQENEAIRAELDMIKSAIGMDKAAPEKLPAVDQSQ